MRHLTKTTPWQVVAMILILALAACGPAQAPADTSEEETAAEEAPATEEDTSEEAVPETEETTAATAPETVEEPTAPEPVELLEIEGAITTESGLQYLEKVAGDGPAPEAGDIVTMHFTGTLPDGTLIGDSYTQGVPITAVLGQGQLMPGWDEGVFLMKEGGQAQLVLPPELAFGVQGTGAIPPNSQIVLDVELLTVEAAPTPMEVAESDLETTASGLQYYDIEEGSGDAPNEGDSVSTNYTLWLRSEEGDQFLGTSNDQGPVSFIIGDGGVVFPGWEEGASTMQLGGKRYIVVPPELGLGAQGGGSIPPDSTLVLEIELVDVREPANMTEVDEGDYTTTDSGLQYYDIEEGDGVTPAPGQTVVVHYTGWLEDGTKFDSSLDRGQPFTFPLGMGSVIAGWDEGLATMKVGGKRQLVIPAELGYGDGGSGQIPPGATLIFDVELVDVQ